MSKESPAHPPRPGAFLLAAVLLLAGCGRAEVGAARFVEITAEVGLDARFDRAAGGTYFMPDSLAAGGAFLDYDRDGDLDVYLVQGFFEPGRGAHNPEGANRLFRQEADGRFTDVSVASGANDPGYGMGVAVGDVDDDGFPDLFLANYGPDVLYHNQGDGTFRDITREAGLGDPRWASSAGFLDYDDDGDLDLFVAHYVDYRPGSRTVDAAGRPEYPGPLCCPGVPDVLYRNEGRGRFRDVSTETGIAAAAGRGLGVVFGDLDGDGRLDIYVANDREPNYAWIQQPDGTFVDRAPRMGLAVDAFGAPEASMGTAFGDVTGDQRPEIFVTNLFHETNTLYSQLDDGQYEDVTPGSGLGPPSLDFTGFGTAFFDPDMDGDLDVLVANGRVLRAGIRPGADLAAHWLPYAEENQYYENDGQGHFRRALEACGSLCAEPGIGRGLAVGDVDDDGDPDVLITTGDGRARLYRNRSGPSGHWLGVRALERAGKREVPGAVILARAGDRELRRDIAPATSYLSSHDPRALFGLGAATVAEVVVRWPGGVAERYGPLNVDRYHDLVRGRGASAR